jgi:hypothetical protein
VCRQVPLGKKLSCCTLLEVFKVEKKIRIWSFTHRKSCEVKKTSLICSRSTNEIFSELLLWKNKNGEIKQLQSTA